ncbi:hypothetical protein D3H64_04945 [Atopobacter sp. AH10]|uniref:acyltransferase domain-containing protein n=1 Tax=Atopobacter sp. AH10 TaxID=2315861 RepID=UPI000EF1E0B3|nr:acyltransferase domain-containing protein [Atopobacter sp. AH10]RLK63330.1 hypothetical protein D3H64_04945 [Atopobacter sp. AH10]
MCLAYLKQYFDKNDSASFLRDLKEIIEGKSPRANVWLRQLESSYEKRQELALRVMKEGWPHGLTKRSFELESMSAEDRLLTLLMYFPATVLAYQQKGIPLEILEESLKDFYLRERLYWERHAQVGLSFDDAQWLLRIFALKIFKLGALQFELFQWQADQAYYHIDFTKEQREFIGEGRPVLATHIMQEEDISLPSAKASFDQAKRFFPHYFPDFPAKEFYCFSWLLYPGLTKALGKNSRIIAFQSLFQIFAQTAWPDMALKRLFEESPISMRDSSLQRLAKEDREILGAAIGIRRI